jgi:hypothetical protein
LNVPVSTANIEVRAECIPQEEILNNLAIQTQGTVNEKLWLAVIDSAIADWVNGPDVHQRKAEFFLFQDQDDFPFVCRSAGLDPEGVRESLWVLRAHSAFEANANVA